MQTPGPTRRPFVVVAAIATVVLLATAGCGSSPQPQAPASPAKATTLDSRQGGFSLSYPASFVKVEPDVSAQPGLIYQVYLADPTGVVSGGNALDVLGVSVHRISKTAAAGDLARREGEFRAIAMQLIGAPVGLRLVAPFEITELGGRPALKVEYVYTVKGIDVATVAYLVPSGKRVYWVTGQASRKTWTTTGRVIGGAISTITFTAPAGSG